MHPSLRSAIAAVLAMEAPAPEAPPLRDIVRAQSGEKFGNYTVEPVPPEHPHAPRPRKFNVVGSVAYVLEADWPLLRDTLMKNRARAAGIVL
jgi:hypothetical protein